jgi:hypothetical protein
MNAHVPTVAEVERIAGLADPAIRNLQITQCYHELALGLAQRTGGGANWCAFATWASKQAGQTIRKADLFRCYHEQAALFDTPFSAEQVAALKAGRLPEGRL